MTAPVNISQYALVSYSLFILCLPGIAATLWLFLKLKSRNIVLKTTWILRYVVGSSFLETQSSEVDSTNIVSDRGRIVPLSLTAEFLEFSKFLLDFLGLLSCSSVSWQSLASVKLEQKINSYFIKSRKLFPTRWNW